MQTTLVPTAVAPSSDRAADITAICKHLAEGQRLVGLNHLNEAAALVWSAFEAAVHLSLTELGQQTDAPIWISNTPHGLSAQAVAYGVIDPDDRDVLLRFLSVYDASADDGAETINGDLLQKVIRFTGRTLDEMQQ